LRKTKAQVIFVTLRERKAQIIAAVLSKELFTPRRARYNRA
jgi:hypothetical protein